MRRIFALVLAVAAMAAGAEQPGAKLAQLVKDGQLKLSLQDAISLALENNLDIALERLGPDIAAQDLKRAQAGASLRGIPTAVREGPRATGGPTGQVQGLTSLTATSPVSGTSQEQNLSVTGTTPLASGVAPPSLDPSVTGELSWKHTSAPQAISFLAGVPALDTNTTTGNASFNMGFLTGASFVGSFNNTRISSNNIRDDLDPYTQTSLGFTLTQPLMKGAGKELNSRFIRIARNNGKVADLLFQQQIISTTTVVVQLYWDYVSLRDDLTNREATLAAAQKLLDDQKEQLKSGVVAPVDVARAQAEVARAKRDLAAAKTLVEQQANVLKEYLTGKREEAAVLDTVDLLPTDKLPEVAEPSQPFAEMVTHAIASRPDYMQARLQVENSKITLEGSRNALKPQVDAYVTAAGNSLSGAASTQPLSFGPSSFILPRTPNAAFIGNYFDGLGQIFKRNYPDYGAGIKFNLPIHNRAAEADYARDQIEVKRQNIRIEQLEKDIRVDIKNALSALKQARASLESAIEERKAQEQVLTAEQERLKVGVTNASSVINFQRDLAQAQATEVTARAALIKAKASLDRASGGILETYNISIDQTHTAHTSGGGAK